MMKLKSDVVHVKEKLGGLNRHDCVWHTFKKGSVIPERFVKQVLAQGRELEEVVVVEEKPVIPEELPVKEEEEVVVVEKPKRKRITKKKKA